MEGKADWELDELPGDVKDCGQQSSPAGGRVMMVTPAAGTEAKTAYVFIINYLDEGA